MTVPTLIVKGTYAPGTTLRVTGKEYHYLARVLRVRRGDAVRVTSGDGSMFNGVVSAVGASYLTVEIASATVHPVRSTTLTLVASGLKRRGSEALVCQCAELGIDRLIFANMRRTVALTDATKLPRLSRLAGEAARRVAQPFVTKIEVACDIKAAVSSVSGSTLYFFWEREGISPHSIDLATTLDIAFFVGPEGGFDPYEIRLLKRAAAHPVRLNGPAYRAETAAFIASVLFSFLAGRI